MHFSGPRAKGQNHFENKASYIKTFCFIELGQCFTAQDLITHITMESNKAVQLTSRESRFRDRLLHYERTFFIKIQKEG